MSLANNCINKCKLEEGLGYELPLVIWPYRFYNEPGDAKYLQGEVFLIRWGGELVKVRLEDGEDKVNINENLTIFDMQGNRLGHMNIYDFEVKAKVLRLVK